MAFDRSAPAMVAEMNRKDVVELVEAALRNLRKVSLEIPSDRKYVTLVGCINAAINDTAEALRQLQRPERVKE
jgi:hypothetical protein